MLSRVEDCPNFRIRDIYCSNLGAYGIVQHDHSCWDHGGTPLAKELSDFVGIGQDLYDTSGSIANPIYKFYVVHLHNRDHSRKKFLVAVQVSEVCVGIRKEGV